MTIYVTKYIYLNKSYFLLKKNLELCDKKKECKEKFNQLIKRKQLNRWK